MAPFGNRAAAGRKHLRVLLPFSRDSLRIPDKLAAEIGAGEVLVVGPSGGEAKVWPVEVGRDGDGAFLGRGWPEFAAACGAGAGWLLVLRHRGRGVLTVKAFDASCYLTELGTPPPAVEATTSSKVASCRPQFISVLSQDFMEKMLIPVKFVQHYIPKEHLNNRMAIIFGPLCKICQIELEMNRLDVFFAVSTLPDSEELQEAPSPSVRKRNSKNEWSSSEGQNNSKGFMTCLKRGQVNCVYDIGPPAWMKKLDHNMVEKHKLSLPRLFCDVIGFQEPCIITLQAPMDSTRSWQVHGFPYKTGSCQLGAGWKKFCQDNELKEGDVCTIKVVETTLWHVNITRRG